MVLAAGLGSRLRPLTALLPKPLVPVGDRPALAHALDRLAAAGLRRVVVNAHHGAAAMRAFMGTRPGVALSEEAELLGTAGGVAAAAALLGEGDLVVWNADILAGIDPVALIAAHAAGPAREATLVVQPREAGKGGVGLDRAGRVVRLRGERVAEEWQGAEFLGVHVLGAGLRGRLPPRGCLVGDVYIPAMHAGAKLQAYIWDAPFFDIGTVQSYLDANLAWLAARGEPHWAGPGTRVGAGVNLRDVVLGEGAVVTGRGALERCVVWPGASVEAPLCEAIVAPGHLVLARPC
jgi:mannose-1-phosphate guanylyltransferase